MKKKQSLSTITLVILFLISYFYLDYIGVEILVKILASGFFVGLCTYILYGLKASKGLRIAVLFLVIVTMGVFFWCVAKDAVKERERIIDKRFLGEWETDTIGGYAIYLRVQADSAYLSQSNMTLSRSYRLVISHDTITLVNERIARVFRWNFRVLDSENKLQLTDGQDTLLLKRIR
ncbi:hypothetical protein [Chitinophaga sp.]|uniref:hypothetical protein n=1 Tax=Chitinophaga sp. TaxID=1869181 RepID=UPI0031E3C03C